MGKKKPAKRKKATHAARQANPDLWEYYQFGCQVLEEEEQNPEYIVRFREEADRTDNDIYQARVFALLCQNKELDLEWLCKLGSKAGKPLGRCHIHRLVHVADKRRRKTLARKAGSEGWSVQRLTDEIRKTRAEHSRQGRLGKRPETVPDALVRIEKMVRRFSRLQDVLQEPEGGAIKVSLKDLPGSVKSPLKRIFAELEGLQVALNKRIAKS